MTLSTLAVASPAHAETVSAPLSELIASLPVAAEDRTGYSRDLFKHWVDQDRDGCNTRNEVLLEEATVAPEVTGRCTITADTGSWESWYDDTTVTSRTGIDIDHLIPLAEAWDSGASDWSAGEREQYANDLGDPRSLLAVTARSNRSKSDQDVSEWLPPDSSVHCRYVADWTAVKTRWGLSVDLAEQAALLDTSSGCEDVVITVDLAR